MNRKQVLSVLAVIASAYPNQFEAGDKTIIETWTQFLRKEDFEAVKSGVMDYLGQKKPFPPTIGEVCAVVQAKKGPMKTMWACKDQPGWYWVEVQSVDEKGVLSKRRTKICSCSATERLETRRAMHEKGLLYVERIRASSVIYYFTDKRRDLALIRNDYFDGMELPVFQDSYECI